MMQRLTVRHCIIFNMHMRRVRTNQCVRSIIFSSVNQLRASYRPTRIALVTNGQKMFQQ